MRLRYFLRGLGVGILFAVLVIGISTAASGGGGMSDSEVIERARDLGMVMEGEADLFADEGEDTGKTDMADEGEGSDGTSQQDKEDPAKDALTDADEAAGDAGKSGATEEAADASNVAEEDEANGDAVKPDAAEETADASNVTNAEETDGDAAKPDAEGADAIAGENHTGGEKEDGESEPAKGEGSQDASGTDGESEKAGDAPEVESILPGPKEEEKKEVVSKITISGGMSSKQVSTALEKIGLVESMEDFDDFLCDNGYASRIHPGTYKIEGEPTYKEIAEIITGGGG